MPVNEIFSRNEMFWGKDCQNILSHKHTAVFGLGGVGGYCAEALARAGVGKLTIIDFDDVSVSNINRQIIALNSTVGKKKAILFAERLRDINPDIKLNVFDEFYVDEFEPCVDDFVELCRRNQKLTINDLPIISHEDYQIQWSLFCQQYFRKKQS